MAFRSCEHQKLIGLHTSESPRLVQAWMILELGTLNGLDKEAFARHVVVAATHVREDPSTSEALAMSLGL